MQDTRYKIRAANKGVTLTEMTIVIAIVALLAGLSIPAVRTFFNSLALSSGTRSLISSSLASAHAIAAKQQRYAGVRFQQDLSGQTYLVFVVNSPITINTVLPTFQPYPMPYRYLAMEGMKPVKLPDGIGVIGGDLDADLNGLIDNSDFDNVDKMKYVTTFVILFSPQGNLVRKDYMVLPDEDTSDGLYDPLYAGDVFSGQPLPESGLPLQADDSLMGRERLSTGLFSIYSIPEFQRIPFNNRYDGFVRDLETVHINPYTGTIISSE